MCSPAVLWRHVVGDDDDDDEVCSYGLGYGRCLDVTLGPCYAESDLLHTSKLRSFLEHKMPPAYVTSKSHFDWTNMKEKNLKVEKSTKSQTLRFFSTSGFVYLWLC